MYSMIRATVASNCSRVMLGVSGFVVRSGVGGLGARGTGPAPAGMTVREVPDVRTAVQWAARASAETRR